MELSGYISRSLFYYLYVVCNKKINLEIKTYFYSTIGFWGGSSFSEALYMESVLVKEIGLLKVMDFIF